MSGCGACLHGRKRKCICGGKQPRKRLKHAEVLNARGEVLGFAAASAAAAAAQRAWLEPVAPMGGGVAAAVATSARGAGASSTEVGVVDAWRASSSGGFASPRAVVQPACCGRLVSAATASVAGDAVAASGAVSACRMGTIGTTGAIVASGATTYGGGVPARCGSGVQAAGGGTPAMMATVCGAGGALTLGGAGPTVTATAWARDASLRATHSLCTQCNNASPRGVSYCQIASCQAPMAGLAGEAYKATQARREAYVFESMRGRNLRYMQGREQESESLCAGRGARTLPHT